MRGCVWPGCQRGKGFGTAVINAGTDVANGYIRTYAPPQKQILLDHSVSLCDQPCRYFEAKLFGHLEVDDQLEMGFLKKRHLCWVAAINASFDVFELTLRISLPIDFR